MGVRWACSCLLAAVMLCATVVPAVACTGITLLAADGSVARGRTLEFGTPLDSAGSDPPYEITEWTTMSDLEALTFSIWTHDNRAIRTLDLNAVDLDGSEIQTFALDQPRTFIALGES